ncbi:hypothetical protein ACVWZ3_002254 [Bradyrhizobium sp. i1.3.6]
MFELGDTDGRLLCTQGETIVVALLCRQPALLDQIAVARIGDVGELPARLRLLQGGLVLGQRRLGLGDLLVELRSGDCREKIAFLDPIADIHVALFDIATGPREDIGCLERGRRRRQGNLHQVAAGPDHRHPHLRNGGSHLLRHCSDLTRRLIVPPAANAETAREQQQHPSSEQRAAVTASGWRGLAGELDDAAALRIGRVPRLVVIGPHTNVAHSGCSSNTPW